MAAHGGGETPENFGTSGLRARRARPVFTPARRPPVARAVEGRARSPAPLQDPAAPAHRVLDEVEHQSVALHAEGRARALVPVPAPGDLRARDLVGGSGVAHLAVDG